MLIGMYCSGMPFDGDTINNESLGGSETAAYYMARELAAVGHRVYLFTNCQQGGEWDGVTYIPIGQRSEQYPLGQDFTFWATHTPHDVLIIQRVPNAFNIKYASKVNLWWLHDLATVNMRDAITGQMWNVDGVLTVSQFHKDQVCEVWGLNPDIVHPITNGVDLSLFEDDAYQHIGSLSGRSEDSASFDVKGDGRIRLLYSSRPERGLEWLVKPDGIMAKLWELDKKFHLYVCGYDNTTPQMAPYYEQLWQACDVLPNVTRLGALTKQQLADVMRQCDAMVYPTPGPRQPDFEEVSCITAMECMAAGLPFISSQAGALPETCRDSGSVLVPLKDGLPDMGMFLHNIQEVADRDEYRALATLQKACAPYYSWAKAAQRLMTAIDHVFARASGTIGARARDLMEKSDIYTLRHLLAQDKSGTVDNAHEAYKALGYGGILGAVQDELHECYQFMEDDGAWRQHYEAYYEYEKQRGVDYGPENLQGNDRFEAVCAAIARLGNCARVLDYGCAHGHYTINLAKRFPAIKFVGIDIAQSNIDKAKAWAESDGVGNVAFCRGAVEDGALDLGVSDKFDVILAAEVLEHVAAPWEMVDVLCGHLADGGTFLATTPYGPWEAVGYEEHWPWRAHVHHFDDADLRRCFGHHPGFTTLCIPSGPRVGSYLWQFSKPAHPSAAMDYDEKLVRYVPRQTVTLCMIVRDAEATVAKTLKSAFPFVDEIIIHIDEKTTDNTMQVIEQTINDGFGHKPWSMKPAPSATEVGFDEARNATLAEASGDWILWLDADEELFVTGRMYDMLRNNQFNGYCIPQHHFALQPLGVLKTDYPCRLFRNGLGMRFFGVVHEHPELALNQGQGHVMVTNEAQIVHPAYTIEEIRRERFDRNLPLLVRDREKYPERKLGWFLWLRDLAQMTMRSAEKHGGRITPQSIERAKEGIEMWEQILKDGDLRMVIDSLEFYSICVRALGEGFAVDTRVAIEKTPEKLNGAGIHIKGQFKSTEHYMAVLDLVAREKTKLYGSKYYV